MRKKYLYTFPCLLPLVLTPLVIFYQQPSSTCTMLNNKTTLTPNNGMWTDKPSVIGSQPSSIAEVKSMPLNEVLKFNTFDGRFLGDVTPIRNQTKYNICWAYSFAAISSTNILYQPELFTEPQYQADVLNISPFNIDNIVNIRKGDYDPLGLTKEDTVNKRLWGDSPVYNFSSAQMFFQGKAPIQRSGEDDTHAFGNRIATLKDVVKIPNSSNTSSNVNEIKKAIVKYGAVTINYNQSTKDKVYYPTKNAPSHASAIVGWMDNINKDLFTNQNAPHHASQNGAWIVKNSWGPGILDDGYFYLSYDAGIEHPTAFNYGLADLNDNFYYYDGKGEASSNPVIGNRQSNNVAAIFPVLKANNEKNEILKSISFAAKGNANMQVKASIYGGVVADLNNPTNTNNNPTNGILLYEQTDNLLPYESNGEYEISHTMELKKPILLEPNSNYGIVLEFIDKTGNEFLFSNESSTNDMTYIMDDNQWISLTGLKDSLGDHPVATIHATTILQDKPTDNSKDIASAIITPSKKSVEYNPDNNYAVNLEVAINGHPLSINQYDTKIIAILKSNGNAIGTLNIIVAGKNEYTGYQSIELPITKAPYPHLEQSNIIFNSDNTITITIDDSFTHQLSKFSDISLPENWSFIHPNDVISEHTQIVYSGEHPEYYQTTTLNTTINIHKIQSGIDKTTVNIKGQYTYNGNEITPEFTVIYNSQTLILNQDYEVKYSNNIDVGTAQITVTGKNYFTGEKNINFEITKANNEIYKFWIEDAIPKINAKFNAALAEFTYYQEKEAINEIAKPTTSGTYYVKAYIPGTNNFNEISSDVIPYILNIPQKSNNLALIISLSVALPLLLIVIITITIYIIKKRKIKN